MQGKNSPASSAFDSGKDTFSEGFAEYLTLLTMQEEGVPVHEISNRYPQHFLIFLLHKAMGDTALRDVAYGRYSKVRKDFCKHFKTHGLVVEGLFSDASFMGLKLENPKVFQPPILFKILIFLDLIKQRDGITAGELFVEYSNLNSKRMLDYEDGFFAFQTLLDFEDTGFYKSTVYVLNPEGFEFLKNVYYQSNGRLSFTRDDKMLIGGSVKFEDFLFKFENDTDVDLHSKNLPPGIVAFVKNRLPKVRQLDQSQSWKSHRLR